MSTKTPITENAIPFGTPVDFHGREGIYVEFVPDHHDTIRHKLLINWGDHPYLTFQELSGFSLRQPSPSVDMEHKSLDMVKDFREAHLMATKLATDTHGPMPDVGEDDEPNDPWHCFYNGAMTMFNDLRVLEARPSAGEEGEQWIPVSTLPKEHRSCWVLVPVDPAHHEGERWVVAEMIRDGDYWHDHTGEDLNDYSNHITHWQYVVRPSPPKK